MGGNEESQWVRRKQDAVNTAIDTSMDMLYSWKHESSTGSKTRVGWAASPASFWARLMQGPLAEAFGGGEKGRKIAEFIMAVEHDLPLPPAAAPAPNGQTQSSPVKDSQG
jgi:hypothetical protein